MNLFLIIGSFPEPYLLAASRRRIAVVDLTSNFSKIVFDENMNIKNFFVDPVNEKMYVTNGKIIYRMSFDGSDKEVIYKEKNNWKIIQEVAFDWVGRNMFWVYSKKSIITTGNETFSHKLTFSVRAKDISSLKIDPVAG